MLSDMSLGEEIARLIKDGHTIVAREYLVAAGPSRLVAAKELFE